MPDAETDTITAQLEATGLLESYVTEDGREAYRLTPKGEPVERALVMAVMRTGTACWER